LGGSTGTGHTRAVALLERPRLEARLDGVFGKRLTTLTAGAGYGKTTLLAQWSQDVACAWHTFGATDRRLASFTARLARRLEPHLDELPADAEGRVAPPDDAMRADAIAAHVAGRLEGALDHDFVLILDDVHELGQSPSARLVAGLVRQVPPSVHVVLSSRAEPPFRIQRLRGQDEVLELDAAELAFGIDEIEDLLELMLDAQARALASELHALTAGWPAAVRLAVRALEQSDPADPTAALQRLRHPNGPLLEYLAEEVLDREPPGVRRLIGAVASFDRFTPDLCEELGLARSREAIDALRRRGFFLAKGDDSAGLSLHAIVREFAHERLAPPEDERHDLELRAAAWFEREGWLDDAQRALRAGGDDARFARFLVERGEELLSRGGADALVEAALALPERLRTGALDEILGEAYSVKGDSEQALACYGRAAGDDETLPTSLAWRFGRLYWDLGQLDEATSVFARGRLDGSSPADEALLLAWSASPHWSSGDVDRAADLAAQALDVAKTAGSPRALAAAHNALGLTHLGRDNAAFERHMVAALEAAKEAGDILQVVRFTVNRCGPAEPTDAIAWLAEAISFAELAGAPLYLARALNARGENALALGRFDDAGADFRRALSLWEQHGSARRAWALMSLASVARQRGDLTYARAAFREALEASDDAQGRINAGSGLARVLGYDDPDEARRLAEVAVDEGRRLGYLVGPALIAAGWVALARGEAEQARGHARDAAAETHRQRVWYEYAEALELEAIASLDPDRAPALLEESAEVWRQVGKTTSPSRASSSRWHHWRQTVGRSSGRVRSYGRQAFASRRRERPGCSRASRRIGPIQFGSGRSARFRSFETGSRCRSASGRRARPATC
jgi:tetratricopeptide (TPR) repeat protein